MYPIIKRVIDVLAALVLIVLLAPIGMLTALAVKLSSPGPVFFVQTRGGLGGRPFPFFKFRTMRSDHVHDPGEIVPLSHGAVTAVGRFLRRTKIDELPQLINVVRGDVSLVGPRPTILEQIERYSAFQKRRLEVRPGCTGLAQVNGNAEIPWEERIKYDVYYVDHLGPLLDLQILLKTVLVVLLGEKQFTRPFEQSPYR